MNEYDSRINIEILINTLKKVLYCVLLYTERTEAHFINLNFYFFFQMSHNFGVFILFTKKCFLFWKFRFTKFWLADYRMLFFWGYDNMCILIIIKIVYELKKQQDWYCCPPKIHQNIHQVWIFVLKIYDGEKPF